MWAHFNYGPDLGFPTQLLKATISLVQYVQQFLGDQLVLKPQQQPQSPRDLSRGSSLLVGGPGLSQWPVIWHGSEERVPQLAVDEEHNEQHQQEEQQAHDYVCDQVRFVELALPESSSPHGGSQESGHAHRPPMGGVQGGRVVRRGLGHEDQVEVRGVGRVEEDLS